MNKMLQYIFGPKLFRRLAGSGGPDGHVKVIPKVAVETPGRVRRTRWTHQGNP